MLQPVYHPIVKCSLSLCRNTQPILIALPTVNPRQTKLYYHFRPNTQFVTATYLSSHSQIPKVFHTCVSFQFKVSYSVYTVKIWNKKIITTTRFTVNEYYYSRKDKNGQRFFFNQRFCIFTPKEQCRYCNYTIY